MTYAAYPDTLPQFVQEAGYSESLPAQAIESPMDAGEPKIRRRFTKNFRPMQWSIRCEKTQVPIFEHFYLDTLAGGVLPFTALNPRTQVMALYRFRGSPPSYRPFGGINVEIGFQLFQLAQYAEFRFDSTLVTFDSDLITFDETNRF